MRTLSCRTSELILLRNDEYFLLLLVMSTLDESVISVLSISGIILCPVILKQAKATDCRLLFGCSSYFFDDYCLIMV